MKYYIIYEEYTDYNQFEGCWEISVEEFDSIENAESWLNTSERASECKTYERKLIGPLVLYNRKG